MLSQNQVVACPAPQGQKEELFRLQETQKFRQSCIKHHGLLSTMNPVDKSNRLCLVDLRTRPKIPSRLTFNQHAWSYLPILSSRRTFKGWPTGDLSSRSISMFPAQSARALCKWPELGRWKHKRSRRLRHGTSCKERKRAS